MSEKPTGDAEKKRRPAISRRQFVDAIVSAGIVGTIVSFLSLLMSLLPSAGAGQQQGEVDNVFRYGPEKGTWYSDRFGTEVMLEDFDQVGKGAGVLWRGIIPAIVIRVDESKLRGAKATSGLIAFAATCTHLCCISTWHLDRPNEDVLFCRCHDGVFDPYDIVKDVMLNGAEYLGARVIAGPPPRAAPMIPIEIQDGKVAGIPENLQLYGYCG
jgi:Rieske Fe-S protein